MKKAIVSGANGFIGSAVVRELHKRNIDVVALVHQETDMLSEQINTIAYNIDKPFNVLCEEKALQGCDVYFNFAWQHVIGELQSDPIAQLSNVAGCMEQIKLCKRIRCHTFINAGCIFENAPIYTDYTDKILLPSGQLIYGSAKLAAKHMGIALAKSLDLNFIQGTITNAYGPREKKDRFIKTTLKKIVCGEPLQFSAVTQLHDFIYIDDVARAFCAIAESKNTYTNLIIGSGHAKPLLAYINEILDVCKKDLKVTPEFEAVGFSGLNLAESCFDTKTLNDLGFEPIVDFREGITSTMNWLKADLMRRWY